MKTNPVCLTALMLFGMGICLRSDAQWTTQQIPLTSGWNAVFLLVQPDPPDCESATNRSSALITSLCTYNQTFSPVQFLTDTNQFNPETGLKTWLHWYAGAAQPGQTRGLYALRAGKPYLVKTTGSGSWPITGIPVMRAVEWRPSCFNLVGFPVSANSTPTFTSFFAGCTNVVLTKIYRMTGGTNGAWQVADPGSIMRRGEAFWIWANGPTDFQGPLRVSTPTEAGLDFGETLMELPLTLKGATTSSVAVTVSPVLATANTNSADYADWAGPVPLQWWNPGTNSSAIGKWERLTNAVSVIALNITTNEMVLRLAVCRRDLAPFTAPAGHKPVYSSLLQVQGAGMAYDVPVRAVGTRAWLATQGTNAPTGVGLWVGDVVIDKVSAPYASGSNAVPNSVAGGSEFPFRVILHVDSNRNVRLLQNVAMVWQDGRYGPPTNALGYRQMEQAGHYLLVTSNALLKALSGTASQTPARRISSSAFGFSDPLLASGNTTNAVRFFVQTPYDDPLSPYLHRYHPDHNNMQGEGIAKTDLTTSSVTNTIVVTNRFSEIWSNTHINVSTKESFSVTRLIEFEFAEIQRDAPPDWGDSTLGGTYREVITGLHNQSLTVEGAFMIHRVAQVGVLNQ